jgi:manganese/zinc/iron transport system permease protein
MKWNSITLYFFDPILSAPTIGCMLMCLSTALVGVISFLRKQSLLGESLSHAAYPGVVFGVISSGWFLTNESEDLIITIFIMGGACISAFLGLWIITLLERKCKIRSDSALCFVLSGFFGIGITLASYVQFAYPSLYRNIQIYLYGQAATMTDVHIVIYGVLATTILLAIIFFYKELYTISFDRNFARSLGMPINIIDFLVFILMVLAVVIGIRSVGVVLISAMLIAPPAAARQYTNQMFKLLILSALFGLLSGFLGNYLSFEISSKLALKYPAERLSLPTGPMIVLVASAICFVSLLFAPERGYLLRLIRIARFRYKCVCENLLKLIWRFGSNETITFNQIATYQGVSFLYLHFLLYRLTRKDWVRKTNKKTFELTQKGKKRAAEIIRLHRLWELYLVEYIGIGMEKVHPSAEEMEHILTPEIESELTVLLKDPTQDPHSQPIPPKLE